MSDGKLEKPEIDFTKIVDEQLPETEELAKRGGLDQALEQLLTLEKQTRQAITKMVQEVMTYIDSTPDLKTKLDLIDTLRIIYVEVERARLTRFLSKIKEDEGNVNEAADILQELQVETFGSMEKREKTDFILEQMRLTLAKKDYTRMQIIKQYLNVCKYYLQVYDTPSIKEDEQKWREVLENIIYFIVLSPYDNEQHDLLHRIFQDPNLPKLNLHYELSKHFTTPELMRWPRIQELYGIALRQTPVFYANDESGEKRWQELHKRVIEHNIRVVAKYYTRIRNKRLTQLLDLNEEETEEFLSKLVVSKTIYAKIDRPAGIVCFSAPRDANQVLNDWSNNINSLLGLIEKTCHLITKEEMLHSIARVK
ncbi:6419_t:CDS:10 [Diversispora eburnea]|uniref:6419_t:CDS:1 n=1 Tax=Diversispora eburnea TaxID=1213867 RepID=A0A9N8VTG8_9GLOM|nr:6419_t:CDS:10 [Diversispora eburnea]